MGLKIGLVTGEFPPMEGGVGAFTAALAKALSTTGNEIHIITSKKVRPRDQKRSLWEPKEPYNLEYALLHPVVSRWRWGAMSSIAEISARFDLAVVNVQYQASAYDMRIPAINFLPWRLREVTETVVTFHDLRVPYLFPKAGGLRQRVVRHLGKSAEGVISTNPEDYHELEGMGIDPRKLSLIPIGSNIAPSKPSRQDINKVRESLGLTADNMLLGFFGFVNVSKGADLLVQALAKQPEMLHLAFIGATTGSSDTDLNREQLDRLKDLIQELDLGGRIHWTGFLPDAQLSACFQAADLMVMPYRDGVSLRRGTLMAILQHGRPLITTEPLKPIPELAHGENVWLTPVGDVQALSDAISLMLEDKPRQTKIAEGARALSSAFSWDSIAIKTAAFYQQILDLRAM